jgi:hypothetical protein
MVEVSEESGEGGERREDSVARACPGGRGGGVN